ncbi:MAG: hypothetical protein KKB03_03115, partial [Nanoarchaeota archaeon]|nr:hypothetical protein [Nanoarchaeota archaeon]
GTLTGTFSNAFMMLTDPIGYAHKIQEGNYVDNPTGKKGSYGVEITKFDMNYLYIGQPSIIQVNLKNEGSFPAKNVVLGISIPYKEAQKMSEVSGDTDIPYITNLGFTPGSPQNPGTEVKSPRPGVHIWGLRTDNEEEILYTDPPIASMPHQDQYFSLFTGNLTCANYVLFNLKEKSVPIRATVAYDYSVESQLNIEFVSVNEWERRVQNNQLIETQVASSISSSPVKLSISTNSQPIRVDRPFIISLDLKTEVDNSAIDDAVVTMNVPNWLLENDDLSRICFGPGTVTKNVPTTATGSLTGFETVIWKPTSGQYENYPIGSESVTLVCRFYNAESDLEKEIDTLPSKTFNIQARGDYRFYKWKDRKAPVNIGQYCCKDDDCGDDNFKCDLGKGKPGFCIQKDRDFAPHTDGT